MTTWYWCTTCHRFFEGTQSYCNAYGCTVDLIRQQLTFHMNIPYNVDVGPDQSLHNLLRLSIRDPVTIEPLVMQWIHYTTEPPCNNMSSTNTSMQLASSTPQLSDFWLWQLLITFDLNHNVKVVHKTNWKFDTGWAVNRKPSNSPLETSIVGGGAECQPPCNQWFCW